MTATPYPDGDARWDEKIGAAGIAGTVRAVTADGHGRVYVGGDLTSAGGKTVNHVAWWDGERWHDPAGGFSGPVTALAASGMSVYAAGDFAFAGGLPVRHLAVWDGFAWSSVGGGVGDTVTTLAADEQGVLYVGGAFDAVGSTDALHVARWDGQAWSAIGGGVSDDVVGIAPARNGDVFAVGKYRAPGGGDDYHVWNWHLGAWTAIYTTTFEIRAVVAGHDGTAYIGGTFGGGVQRWDRRAWTAAGLGLNGAVSALAVDDDGYVYAAGAFTASGTTTLNGIARWNGTTWRPLGRGLSAAGTALATDPAGLYVGGLFSAAGGKTSVRIGWYHDRPLTGPLTPEPTAEGPCRALDVSRATGGVVQVLTTRNCSGGFVEGTVVRLRADADDGYRWTRWTGDVEGASRLTNLVMTGDMTAGAVFAARTSPRGAVVLLHGWADAPGARERTCPAGRRAVRADRALLDSGTLPTDDIEAFARHLVDDGQEVWLARYTTAPATTASLPDAAACLRDQLAGLSADGVEQAVIVAHDLGGLVARAYLESDEHALDRSAGRVAAVTQLVTIGTPHGAAVVSRVGCRLGVATGRDHPGACVLPYGDIETLETRTYNRRPRDIAYALVSGVRSPALGWRLPWWSVERDHDGLVDADSGVGRVRGRAWPETWRSADRTVVDANNGTTIDRHAVDAGHLSPADWQDPRGEGYPSYFNVAAGDTTATSTYACLRQILGLAQEGCAPADDVDTATRARARALEVAPRVSHADGRVVGATHDGAEWTSTVTLAHGVFLPGQIIERAFPIDTTGRADVTLAWITGTLRLALTAPDGQTIGPSYAATSPDVEYAGPQTSAALKRSAAYFFAHTVAGVYTATITAADVPSGGTDYALSAVVESPRGIFVTTDHRLYRAGATAVITAGLTSGASGLDGADVIVSLGVPGRPSVFARALDEGEGAYVARLGVPDVGGRLPLRVTAGGVDAQAPFSRTALASIYVDAGQVSLAGTYADAARDDDGDGLADALDVDVGLEVTRPGSYLVAADLVSGGGDVIAHSVRRAVFTSGRITATLAFDGDSLRRSGMDGRYRLATITVTDTADGLDPVLDARPDHLTSGVYRSMDFAATCFLLSMNAEPAAGGRVAPRPFGSCNEGLQYAAGDNVRIEAWDNPGWVFTGWSGDAAGDDPTATVRMDRDRAVTAHFAALPSPTPGATPTGTASPTASASPTADATATPITSVTPAGATETPEPSDTALPPSSPTPAAPTPVPTPTGPRPLFLPYVSRP